MCDFDSVLGELPGREVMTPRVTTSSANLSSTMSSVTSLPRTTSARRVDVVGGLGLA